MATCHHERLGLLAEPVAGTAARAAAGPAWCVAVAARAMAHAGPWPCRAAHAAACATPRRRAAHEYAAAGKLISLPHPSWSDRIQRCQRCPWAARVRAPPRPPQDLTRLRGALRDAHLSRLCAFEVLWRRQPTPGRMLVHSLSFETREAAQRQELPYLGLSEDGLRGYRYTRAAGTWRRWASRRRATGTQRPEQLVVHATHALCRI